jgi:hypothetical protein
LLEAEFKFNLIAHYAQPDGLPTTCADRAKEMFKGYHCEGFEATDSGGGFSDTLDSTRLLPSNIPSSSELKSLGKLTINRDSFKSERPMALDVSAIRGSGGQPIDFSGIGTGSTSRIDPNLPDRGARVTLSGKIDLTSSKSPDQDLKDLLGKKKTECKRENAAKLRKTFAAPGSIGTSSSTITPIRDLMDPRWTTTSPEKSDTSATDNKVANTPKNPACKSSGIGEASHYAKLRAAYNEISYRKIWEVLGDWDIFDENGNIIDKDALRLITGPADRFFDEFLNEHERINRDVCGSSKGAMISDQSYGTEIGGRSYTVTIRSVTPETPKPADDKPDEEHKKQSEPVTVATYFSMNSSLIEAVINGAIGADPTGAGTLI